MYIYRYSSKPIERSALQGERVTEVSHMAGFRPLVIGRMKGRGLGGTDGFCIASETCALDMCKVPCVCVCVCVYVCV